VYHIYASLLNKGLKNLCNTIGGGKYMRVLYKRNPMVVVLSLIIAILSLSLLLLNSLRDNGNFHITKLQGDESVLEDLEVRGIIYDNYHAVDFNLKNNSLNENFKYLRSYNDVNNYDEYLRYPEHGLWNKDGLKRGDNTYVARFRGYHNNDSKVSMIISKHINSRDTAFFKTIETELVSNSDLGSYHFNTRFMEEKDDKLYFVIPTDNTFRGKGGIYVINNWQSPRADAGYSKLADIDLEGGHIQVRGMFVVGNSIVVMLGDEGNKVILKVFDLESGKFTHSLRVPDSLGIIEDSHTFGSYLLLSSRQDKAIPSQGFYSDYDFYIFKVDKEISLINNVLMTMPREAAIHDAIYKNDMLYILSVETYGNHDVERLWSTPRYDVQLAVYDAQGRAKFRGRLVTGINDDTIWQLSSNINHGNREPYESRRYALLELR